MQSAVWRAELKHDVEVLNGSGPIAGVNDVTACGEDTVGVAWVGGERVAEVHKRAMGALAFADCFGVRADPKAVVKGVCVAVRSAVELALKWGVVACAAKAVTSPKAQRRRWR